jgi:IclR family acetate operon transcriptional repressor
MRGAPGAPARAGGRPGSRATAAGEDRPGPIQTLDRGLRILDALIVSGRPLRLRDLAHQLGLDKASAFRFLATLERFGLVTKDSRTKAYGIGSRLIAWLATQKPAVQLIEVVRPHLVRLVEETEESGHLAVLGGDQALLVDYVPSRSLVTIKNRIGVYEPLYCTAVGKALLAFLPADARRELIGRLRFQRFTDRTVRDGAALERELAQVRTAGVAVDRGEYHEFVTCIAAPVMDVRRQPIASVGISTVTPLLDRDPRRLGAVTAAVKACAGRVTAQLAGRSR